MPPVNRAASRPVDTRRKQQRLLHRPRQAPDRRLATSISKTNRGGARRPGVDQGRSAADGHELCQIAGPAAQVNST